MTNGQRGQNISFQGVRGIDIRGLAVERGGRFVIQDLTFSVVRGHALQLTGPNGAGKTTLIRALGGLLPVAAGDIQFEGGDADARFCEQCHYVAHLNAAKTALTVRENLQFWARFMGEAEQSRGQAFEQADARALAAIETVGLSALSDIAVGYLSAGQQRRVAIGRLLVAERAVWLLDEPTVSLDAANVARLVEIGNAHLARGGMIIAATHVPLGFAPMTELRLKPIEIDFADTDGADSAGATA